MTLHQWCQWLCRAEWVQNPFSPIFYSPIKNNIGQIFLNIGVGLNIGTCEQGFILRVVSDLMEIFLNEVELSLNLVNSVNLRNHWSRNWVSLKILPVICVFMAKYWHFCLFYFFYKFFVGSRSILRSHWLLLFWTFCVLPHGFQIRSGSLARTLSCLRAVIPKVTSSATPAFSTNRGIHWVRDSLFYKNLSMNSLNSVKVIWEKLHWMKSNQQNSQVTEEFLWIRYLFLMLDKTLGKKFISISLYLWLQWSIYVLPQMCRKRRAKKWKNELDKPVCVFVEVLCDFPSIVFISWTLPLYPAPHLPAPFTN